MKIINHFNRILVSGTIVSSCLLTTACFHEEESGEGEVFIPAQHNAVISTRSGYASGNHSIIKLTDYSAKNTNFASGSDTLVSTFNEDIYRIGKYKMDNITKFNIYSPETISWQFSTNDAVENISNSSNPYKIVFVNESKAYIIRWGSDKVWIVNPSANNITDFRLGVIDLSAYADQDASPEPSDALIINDKLHIVMQRFDTINGYVPGDAYLAIFNTTDDTEIETNSDTATPKGIALALKNPSNLEYLSTNNTLYISGIGRYEDPWSDPVRPAEFTGGIESVNLTDYSLATVVDDGDSETHPYGNVTNVAILNSTRGYFIGYNAAGDNSLYTFNPTNGAVEPIPLIPNTDLSDIEIGPLGDLWVANVTDKGITLIDTADNSIKNELIDTFLTPINIEFVSLSDSINP